MEALKTAPGVIGIPARVYLLPKDVMQLLGCQENKAYQIIREVNNYAKKNGKFTFPQGRANKYMFSERFDIPLETINEVISKEQEWEAVMAYYSTCPGCGSNLDPEEKCDCEERGGQRKEYILQQPEVNREAGESDQNSRKNKIKKEEVEELLGCHITEGQFLEALGYAERKQAYIYKATQREVVFEQWYLIRLTIEYIRNLAFSRLTIKLCQKLDNMEKEHPLKEKGTPTSNHIVSVFREEIK